MIKWDYLVVGAGFSGCTIAERLSNELKKKVLIIDKRNHIGGNSYDEYDDFGVLVHKYGPHYFRTNSSRVIDYLSSFTEWSRVDYKIKSYVDGKLFQFPINLNTWEQIIGRPSTSEEMIQAFKERSIFSKEPKHCEDIVISQVGVDLYEMFYKNYTIKQWGQDPKLLDKSICARIPVRYNRNDLYLNEKFQALPKGGYHKLFETMISNNDMVDVMLCTDFKGLPTDWKFKHIFYTGPIDEFYQCVFGRLPYRSLKFRFENHKVEYFQSAMQINYPNEKDYTRIVEIKHATKQCIPTTTIVYEYPVSSEKCEPFYPIPCQENIQLYNKYRQVAQKEKNMTFLGRLGKYRYYNMDQVVEEALEIFDDYCENKLP